MSDKLEKDQEFFGFTVNPADPANTIECLDQLGDALNELHEKMKKTAVLPSLDPSDSEASEPTRVITVRLPVSLHQGLKDQAHEARTSLNKLCVAKLRAASEVSVETYERIDNLNGDPKKRRTVPPSLKPKK